MLATVRVGHAEAVATALTALLAQEPTDPPFRELLDRLLAGPGRPLDPAGAGKWPAYVLGTAAALGGDPICGTLAAAAVVCLVAAADVVDDLADDEWAEPAITPARAINAAVALAALAHRCVAELVPRVGAGRAGKIDALLAVGYVAAAAAEDADLRLEVEPGATEEDAHTMTRGKAGGLVALACQVGAVVATDDAAVLATVGAFGMHAGTVAQILNDLAGVAPGDPRRGSDLRRRKKTLPVAFALRCAREEGIAPLLAWYGPAPSATPSSGPGPGEEAIARLMFDLGGHDYAAVVADAHRREARAALRRLLRLTGRAAVGDLRRLIPAVRWRIAPDGRSC